MSEAQPLANRRIAKGETVLPSPAVGERIARELAMSENLFADNEEDVPRQTSPKSKSSLRQERKRLSYLYEKAGVRGHPMRDLQGAWEKQAASQRRGAHFSTKTGKREEMVKGARSDYSRKVN